MIQLRYACILFSIVSLLGLRANAESQPKDLVIALKPDKNPEQMLSERAQLEALLSDELKVKVKVIVPSASAVILQGFANGTIDLGYLSALDMINAQKTKVAEILLVGEVKGKTSYESVWLTTNANKGKSVRDLRGKSVAFASRTSTSGYLIPYWDLVELGILKAKEPLENFFGAIHFGTGYASAVQRVLDGTVEAAAVSDYVFYGDKHLSSEEKSKLRVLDTQGPVPTHVIAVSSSLDPKLKSRVTDTLLKLSRANDGTIEKVFSSRLVRAPSNDHLASARAALQKTGLDFDAK